MVINSSGFNPVTPEEYAQNYFARPYQSYNTNLQGAAYPPLPPAINVPDIIDPASGPMVYESDLGVSPDTIASGIEKALSFDWDAGLNSLDSIFSFGSSSTTGAAAASKALAPASKAASTAGTSAAGSIASGLGSAALSAGASIGGGMAAKLVGFEGGHADIGGAILGTLGTAFFGPLGGAVGSFVGTAIGSALGPDGPSPASVVGSNYGITPAGTFQDGGVIKSKHIDSGFASNMQGMVDRFNTSIHQQTGADLSKTIDTLYAGYDKEHGPGFISYNGYYKTDHEHHNPNNYFVFDPNNKQSMVAAFRKYGSQLLSDTGQEYSPDQVAGIVNNALQTLSVEDDQSAGNISPDQRIMIDRKIEQGNKFSDFLKEYNKNYNSNAV